ncbi:hypothetical protein [Streptomyces lichenis]|uniref:Uncharacterized protein n=1 Tax=Streptomyces lichenis TaxID=2306967 RepID=A0ABT0I781_9ACTN|nr:hypothetical protein [Streptomyces lichenis]MCK8677186.1 hypothetical protein [Streptomyces lichenis]
MAMATVARPPRRRPDSDIAPVLFPGTARPTDPDDFPPGYWSWAAFPPAPDATSGSDPTSNG